MDEFLRIQAKKLDEMVSGGTYIGYLSALGFLGNFLMELDALENPPEKLEFPEFPKD